MNYILNLTILVVGLSGLVAQVLVLRELLVNFFGNELTLGVILANWVISEAAGVFIIGRYIDRVKNKINVFIVLEVIFSLLLPIAIYLSRTFKTGLGIPYGEAIGLYLIFCSSLLILLPLGFCHGALFSVGCKIYPLKAQESFVSIGRAYTWETIGTIIGGIILTYLFIPYLNSFQITLVISLANLVICLFLLKYTPGTKLKYIILACIIFLIFSFLSGGINKINRLSIRKQYRIGEVLDYRNSVYGNIAVIKKQEQYTFFYNGLPIITTPYPDITFAEEFGHLPLLFHPRPQNILVVSAGVGGLINEVLKHPIKKLDYAELDPLIIEMLKEHHSKLTERELSDNRVKVINVDGRFFLRATSNKYDVVLIGLSNPSDLSTNRLFTKEFFFLVKGRLNPDGILAFWLPGSLTYLSKELRGLNACILNALKQYYVYVRVIPGDYNIFLASGSKDIMQVSARLLSERLAEQNIKTNILMPAYLDYRLDKKWLDWFMQNSYQATKRINQDFKPIAVFEMLKFSNKKFSPQFANLLEALGHLDLRVILVLIFITTLILFYRFSRKPKLGKLSVAYSILTTGFFGMLANLILIFSFQIFYGYLYHLIGMLISIFMAGIALGSILITAGIKRIRNILNLFMGLEILIIVFSCILALTITRLALSMHYMSLIFTALFFISGLFVGLEFPLASKIYLKEKERVGEVSGLLYAADLLGSWMAGILGGIIFLPILGVFGACMVIVMFKLSSLLLLFVFRQACQIG